MLFAKFTGRHSIKIRVKEDESIAGPQVDTSCNVFFLIVLDYLSVSSFQFILDGSFGSLIAFLSPIQVHILFKLVDKLINPESAEST